MAKIEIWLGVGLHAHPAKRPGYTGAFCWGPQAVQKSQPSLRSPIARPDEAHCRWCMCGRTQTARVRRVALKQLIG